MSTQEQADNDRDKALKDTFPASDPPANSGITGAPKKPASQEPQEAIPTGTPNSDRHAVETAHQSEEQVVSNKK